MVIHIVDDKELNKRMTRVFGKLMKIFEEENFTAKDVLLCIKTIEWEIECQYSEVIEKNE